MPKRGKAHRRRSPRRKRTPRARREDRYDLYQRSVQEPIADVRFLQRVFQRTWGRPARVLREDFCGTALLACEWVRGHPDNRAWGVDLDPEPLKWGREHNLQALPEARRDHCRLVRGNVLSADTPPADITVAFNFSYMIFKPREELRGYFAKARTTLGPEGLFVLDVYGGRDAMKRQIETRDHEGFDYQWDQDHFDPITHDVVNYIHFRFSDGSRMKRAFKYEWRLWTLPELRDLLADAGFAGSDVYWEGTDLATNEGNGVFTRRDHAPDDPAFIAYIVARP